jgi:hypothetical protein
VEVCVGVALDVKRGVPKRGGSGDGGGVEKEEVAGRF